MNRFRNILVWVEQSEAGRLAIRQAADVARVSGAAITLVHCIEPAPRLLNAIYARADELRTALRNEWEGNLTAFAAGLRDEGLDATPLLLEGRPLLSVARQVQEAGHDLLVKPAEETSGKLRLGAIDMQLLRKCPCAVWITGSEEPNDDSILVLVDPSPENQAINGRLLQVGSSLARQRSAHLHVAHVWEAAGVSLLAKRARPEEVAAYAEQAQARAESDLASLLAAEDLALPPERVHLPRGAVREVVPRLVETFDIGLVVLGTVCRTGVAGLIIGNTAETVLARVDRPVLTIKPAGFVSPVTLSAS